METTAPLPNKALKEAVISMSRGDRPCWAKVCHRSNVGLTTAGKDTERQERLEGFTHFLELRTQAEMDLNSVRAEFERLEKMRALSEALSTGKINLDDAVSSFGAKHVESALALLPRDEQMAILRRDAPDRGT
ncbi:MAG: hypothetical protein R3B54_09200 [Bdellovibrionota bacterium]